MSGSLYGGAGLGAAGTGVGSAGGMSLPQLLAMIHASQGGGMLGAAPMPANPLQQGGAPTPMANYIGASPGGGGMAHPMMPPPVAANPPPQAMPAMGAGGTQNILQALAQLRGGQTGVAPTGMAGGQPTGALPGGAGPGALAGQTPGMLAGQMSSAQPIGAAGSPGAGMMPQGAPAQGQPNPGLLALLQHLFQSGQAPPSTGGMPQ